MMHRINFGCGKNPTKDWLNFDNSPAIILANSPIKYWFIKNLKLLSKEQIENINWNKKNKIFFLDAKKKLPFENDSVECIYTSHMLEHLSRKETFFFINESLRVLKKEGVLRLSVPDLQIIINDYKQNNNADAFMEKILVAPPPIETIKQKILLFFSGYRHHQWMYDEESLFKLLKKIGFKDVFVCKAGETNIVNPGHLNLYERSEESVYVEAIKR